MVAQKNSASQESTIRNIQRNTIYGELGGNSAILSINYERVEPVGNKNRLAFRVGVGTTGSADTVSSEISYTGLLEINFLYGKSKNYIEMGRGYTNGIKLPAGWTTIRIGYRYQAKNGFIFRIAPMYIYNFEKLQGNHDVFG